MPPEEEAVNRRGGGRGGGVGEGGGEVELELAEHKSSLQFLAQPLVGQGSCSLSYLFCTSFGWHCPVTQ